MLKLGTYIGEGPMRLRAKIFLLVGGLFFFAFIASQVLEEYLTARNLRFEGEEIHSRIMEHQEAKRQDLLRFAKSLIKQRSDHIDVLFDQIHNYDWLKDRFKPSLQNYTNQTWTAASAILYNNKWIDFIENTNDGEITSLIVMDEKEPSYAFKIEHDNHFSYIMTKPNNNAKTWSGPYVGVPYTLDLAQFGKKKVHTLYESEYFFIFKPNVIFNADIEQLNSKIEALKLTQFPDEMPVDEVVQFKTVLKQIVLSIAHAQKYLKENPKVYRQITDPNLPKWVKDKAATVEDRCNDLNEEVQNMSNASWLTMRYDKISMVWHITTILASQLFGEQPFDKNFPVGMVQMPPRMECGIAALNSKIFFDKTNISSRKSMSIPTLFGSKEEYSRVIYEDTDERLFFGNAMNLFDKGKGGKEREGTLTIAIDARTIVRDISLATSSETFFVSNDRVLKGFNGLGVELLGDNLQLPINKIKNGVSGFFYRNGVEYFYMKITPYDGLNFNFYLIVPKAREFALSMSVNTNAKELIRRIAIQMQFITLAALIIVLFSLNHIARHVTDPIAHLARACRILGHGRLEEIHLPVLKRKHKDEVYTLYHSFASMIQGLKEKEKVQGVLNKVVSPTIAQEILKGNIHLGGEEKVVTVLFADIRNFTKMSERMEPHDLINLLNTCMTKISHVIDTYGGVIDKYVGDEVMALFGAPLPDEKAALKAVHCGFEILRVLDDWNCQRVKEHMPIVEMGIGIHTGVVIAGNMGAENRLNYTVLGSNVNLASRLCSAAKPSEILISHMTKESDGVNEEFETKSLDKMVLKGFSEPIEVFEVVRPISLKPQSDDPQ